MTHTFKQIALSIFAIPALMIASCGSDAASSQNQQESAPATDTTTKAERPITALKPGDVAPTFSLKNIDGKIVSLADYKDAKGAIVIFTCNHCPYAKAYEDRIVALDKKYAPLGFPVIAINPNDPELQPEDSYEEMKKRAAEKGFTFPYLIDEKQEIYPAYGASKTPHVFIIQKEKDQHIVRYVGAIDDNYEKPEEVKQKFAEKAVDALLEGKEVSPQTSVAIGCSIKDKRTAKN